MNRLFVISLTLTGLLAGTVVYGQALVGQKTSIVTRPDKVEVIHDTDLNTSAGDVTLVSVSRTDLKLSPGFDMRFNQGASKGIDTLQANGMAVDLTVTGNSPDGLNDAVNIAYFHDGYKLAYGAIREDQTLDLAMTADGLDIGGDQVDVNGYSLYAGATGASGRPFVVGEDPAFKSCVTFKIDDVSGTDDFHVGFRRLEPINEAFDDYTDAVSLAIEASADPADIHIETIDDDGANTTTDTTDNLADETETVWCVLVSGAGVVTYTIDGAAPTTTAAFTIDDGDLVIPFIQFAHDAGLAGGVDIARWEVGYQ